MPSQCTSGTVALQGLWASRHSVALSHGLPMQELKKGPIKKTQGPGGAGAGAGEPNGTAPAPKDETTSVADSNSVGDAAEGSSDADSASAISQDSVKDEL